MNQKHLISVVTVGVLGSLLFVFFYLTTLPRAKPPKKQDEIVRLDEPTVTFVNPSVGKADAPVSLVVFSDFQCDACRQNHEVMKAIARTYPDQVRVVWKDMPNESAHPLAVPAALAAHCVDRQKKFWEFADALFQKSTFLSEQIILQTAKDVGVDETSFMTCFNDKSTLPVVQRDVEEGTALGITATPTVFIGRERFVGSTSVDELNTYVQKVLGTK